MDTAMANGGSVCEERWKKVELVKEAIHGLLEDKRKERRRRQDGDGGSVVRRDREEEEDEDDILSLLSKVDELQNDATLDKVKLKPNSLHPNNSENRHGDVSKEVDLVDITKDLNKIKRQNMITHILLGTVVVMTAVWQFSEVSFLLAVQRKLSNPFKSLGELIKGSLKGRMKPVIEASPLPPVSVPDVTRNDLPLLIIGTGAGAGAGNEDD
ncbi:hypothetical protein ABZP36_022775 [Zizania latifolia]